MRSSHLHSSLSIIFFAAMILTDFGVCHADPATLDLGRLEQVSLTVSSIRDADNFYGRRLGLRKTFAQDNLLIYDLGGVRLLIGVSENRAGSIPPPSSTLYLRCAGLKLCMQELESNGIKFDPQPEFVARQAANDLWLVFFKDPDGNSLALMSESPRGYNPVVGKLDQNN